MSNLVYLQYLEDYNKKKLKETISQGISKLGLEKLFKPNMKVLIKPCLCDAVNKDMAETTNPAVVRAVADCLSKMGVDCLVADCPNKKFTLPHLNSVYIETGMLNMANSTKCELNKDLRTDDVEIENGKMIKYLPMLSVINEVDAIINVGKMKLDDSLGYLGSTANVFGVVPGEVRTNILSRVRNLGDYSDLILDIYEKLQGKIVLNVLDAVVALEAKSTPRMLNCLAMSDDSLSLDAAMLSILNIKNENTILKQAKRRDLINADYSFKIVGEDVEKFKVQDFSLVEFDSHTLIPFSQRYYNKHQQRPLINSKKCKGCSICSRTCPSNAILMKYDKKNELYAEIDYRKCILCNKCVLACPYSVVKLKIPQAYKSLVKKINKQNLLASAKTEEIKLLEESKENNKN